MIKVKVERSWSADGYNIWIIDYDPYRRTSKIYQPIDFVIKEMDVTEGAWKLPEPTFQLQAGPMGNAEELLRALVAGIMEAGLAPMTSLDNVKQVEALENNLKDLRDISKSLLVTVNK